MDNNIIFVAGIHGVGKTTLCKYIFQKYNIKHYTASTLIAEAKERPFTTLFIKDIDKNQTTLINAVNQIRDENQEYILDGHFCLLNEFKSIERVPPKTFELLGIKTIIVLTENINTIYTRLKDRSGIEYSLDMLYKLQEDELDYSYEISSVLNVPYIVLDVSNTDEISLNKKIDTIFAKNL